MSAPRGEKLWLPNARGVMQEATALVFNDAPWLEAQGMNFIHPKLSYEVGFHADSLSWTILICSFSVSKIQILIVNLRLKIDMCIKACGSEHKHQHRGKWTFL